MTEQIKILARSKWVSHAGGSTNGCGGLQGDIVKCQLGAQIFYVRENVKLPHFNMNSGERIRLKSGTTLSSKAVQVLELLAPADSWDKIVAAVRKEDGLKRPVIKNSRFTLEWAQRAIGMS